MYFLKSLQCTYQQQYYIMYRQPGINFTLYIQQVIVVAFKGYQKCKPYLKKWKVFYDILCVHQLQRYLHSLGAKYSRRSCENRVQYACLLVTSLCSTRKYNNYCQHTTQPHAMGFPQRACYLFVLFLRRQCGRAVRVLDQ